MAKTLAHTCTIVVAALCTLFASSAYPHGGGLDRYGCHHNRREGNYHCHKGPFAGKTFDSKEELRLQPHSGRPLGERQPQFRTVRRVVDGDTLVLENKERVRLIGVDTPETKHPRKPVEYFGKEASKKGSNLWLTNSSFQIFEPPPKFPIRLTLHVHPMARPAHCSVTLHSKLSRYFHQRHFA